MSWEDWKLSRLRQSAATAENRYEAWTARLQRMCQAPDDLWQKFAAAAPVPSEVQWPDHDEKDEIPVGTLADLIAPLDSPVITVWRNRSQSLAHELASELAWDDLARHRRISTKRKKRIRAMSNQQLRQGVRVLLHAQPARRARRLRRWLCHVLRQRCKAAIKNGFVLAKRKQV